MQVDLSPELEAKLTRLAADQGRDALSIVLEAVERLISYDEWFHAKAKQGAAASDRGEMLNHEEVGKRLEDRIEARLNRP
jgi:predicted transcriptional regulator